MFISPTLGLTLAKPHPPTVEEREEEEEENVRVEELDGDGEGVCVPLVPPPALFKPPRRPLLHIFVSVCMYLQPSFVTC